MARGRSGALRPTSATSNASLSPMSRCEADLSTVGTEPFGHIHALSCQPEAPDMGTRTRYAAGTGVPSMICALLI